jgi:hypothetical protein
MYGRCANAHFIGLKAEEAVAATTATTHAIEKCCALAAHLQTRRTK